MAEPATDQPTGQPTTRRVETRALEVPGAVLTYDVHGDLADASPDRPTLLLVASPMDASGFGTLVSHFPDRPVVTYDPRGIGRSTRTDGAVESTPEEHASDILAVADDLGVEAVDLFASSGGAVNGLALVAAHPDRFRVLVAHEPPLVEVLPDRDNAMAACEDIVATYDRDGVGPAMAKFIALISRHGELPDTWADDATPDPAMFGLPAEDDGSRADPMLGQNLRTCVTHRPDVPALRSAGTRVVVAAGAESQGELANRAAHALAERLGGETVEFPSNHGGFLGGEHGQHGDPEGFAATLRGVLDGG